MPTLEAALLLLMGEVEKALARADAAQRATIWRATVAAGMMASVARKTGLGLGLRRRGSALRLTNWLATVAETEEMDLICGWGLTAVSSIFHAWNAAFDSLRLERSG